MQENTKNIEYNYKVNVLVLVYYKKTQNREVLYKGPYKSIKAWTIVTATLHMRSVHDRV